MWFNNECGVYELLINLRVCASAKYGEASAKASHDQPYVHMIKYSMTITIAIIATRT